MDKVGVRTAQGLNQVWIRIKDWTRIGLGLDKDWIRAGQGLN